MDTLVKCAGIAVVGAILCLMTRKQSGEFGVMASLGAGVLVITLGLSFFRPLMDFSQSLQETASLGSTTTGPVYKALAMGFLTEIGANICEDAGEKSIASALRLSGGVAAVYVLLPLMEQLLSMLRTML